MEGVIVAAGGQRVVVTADDWRECCEVLGPCVGVEIAKEIRGAVVDA
jgi:hypothetical protein